MFSIEKLRRLEYKKTPAKGNHYLGGQIQTVCKHGPESSDPIIAHGRSFHPPSRTALVSPTETLQHRSVRLRRAYYGLIPKAQRQGESPGRERWCGLERGRKVPATDRETVEPAACDTNLLS